MSASMFNVAPTADNPRLAAAMVLAAFAVDASLPPASWHMALDGSLSGTIHSEDGFNSYLAVMGAEFLMPTAYGQQLITTYRGLRLSLAGMYAGAAAGLVVTA